MSMHTWVLLRGLKRESGHWGDFPARLQRASGSRARRCRARVIRADPALGLRFLLAARGPALLLRSGLRLGRHRLGGRLDFGLRIGAAALLAQA